ncbi:hypothetical protein ABZY57_19160 [Streptomyces sp. NPDC006450]
MGDRGGDGDDPFRTEALGFALGILQNRTCGGSPSQYVLRNLIRG